jgi:GH15 family glucan-1,4-alpha-glucosidase
MSLPEQSAAIERDWIEYLERVWMEPDEGIGEARGGRQQFTQSEVMAWVAVDRAIKDCERFNLSGPLDHRCARGFKKEGRARASSTCFTLVIG